LEANNRIPRAQRESHSSPEPPQRAQDQSRGAPKYAKRSGIGPQRALKAITTFPRAQRQSHSSPEPSCERRTDPAERRESPSARRPVCSSP
jgi:hypothetical protein